jgi:hypothetical protein
VTTSYNPSDTERFDKALPEKSVMSLSFKQKNMNEANSRQQPKTDREILCARYRIKQLYTVWSLAGLWFNGTRGAQLGLMDPAFVTAAAQKLHRQFSVDVIMYML